MNGRRNIGRVKLDRAQTPGRLWCRWGLLLCLLGLGSSCGALEDANTAFPTLSRLEITPVDPVLETDGTAGPLPFSAVVYWDTGDVVRNAVATWSSSNQTAGTIDAEGVFSPSTSTGGVTTVTASYLGISASTTLTVVFTRDVVLDGLPDTLPVQAVNAEVGVDTQQAPRLLYPLDGVIMPRNLARFDVQWTPVPDRPLTMLEFVSATTRTRVFTTADRFVPSASLWQSIAATNRGGGFEIVAYSGMLEGEGSSAVLSGALIRGDAPTRVGISRLDATGSIYYWSIREFSIKRIQYGASAVVDFFTPGPDEGGCVSCHSLNAQGDRMAVVYPDPGESGHRLGMLALSETGPPTEVQTFDDEIRGGRGAFSPDGRYFVSVNEGRTALHDGRTGRYLSPLDLGFERVVNVAFSPDGEELTFVVPETFFDDTKFYDARLASIPFDAGVVGAPEWLTPKVEGATQYYPAYSPDGAWIAYNQSRSAGTDSPEGDSLMDLTSEVYLIARGGGVPIHLERLGAIDPELLGPPTDEPTPPPEPGLEGYANSLPVWGPLPDADLLWLSITSVRGFGHDVERGLPQIWIAAIDPTLAELGEDPSVPPFWLPLQDPQEHNHIPQWGPY